MQVESIVRIDHKKVQHKLYLEERWYQRVQALAYNNFDRINRSATADYRVQKEVKAVIEKVRSIITIEIMEKFQHAHKYIYFYKAQICIVK